MNRSATDRIEKKFTLSATRSRVWRAVSDSTEFGQWFRCQLEGAFVPGKTITGKVTYPGYEHLTVELDIVSVVPERYLSYRWRPNAVDTKKDYSAEPKTLVEFELEEVPGGTQVTIVESGFDALPAERRALAFRANESGWGEQAKNIARHVA